MYLTLCPENGNWVDFDHAVVLLPIHTVHSSFDMALDNRNESMKSISIFHAIYRNDWDCVVLICCVAADDVVVVLFIVISMLWMREMNDILWREALYEKYREEIEKKKNWMNEPTNTNALCVSSLNCGWMCECCEQDNEGNVQSWTTKAYVSLKKNFEILACKCTLSHSINMKLCMEMISEWKRSESKRNRVGKWLPHNLRPIPGVSGQYARSILSSFFSRLPICLSLCVFLREYKFSSLSIHFFFLSLFAIFV